MKKTLICILSIFCFLFLFENKIGAEGYEGKLGYDYAANSTRFFYLSDNNNKQITLHIENVSDTDMIYIPEDGVWYATVNEDLKGKEYYYEICFSNLVCENVIDPFANSINIAGDRNVILDAQNLSIDGYKELKTTKYDYYKSSIYAIETEKFAKNLIVDTTSNSEQIEWGEQQSTPYVDSIFNRLTANTSYAKVETGFNYILSLQMRNLELDGLYDENNYFAANQSFSTKENNYSAILELKNLIMKYKNNQVNIIARMNLLTPNENLRNNLESISSDFVLDTGKINLNNLMMKRYILEVYKYWAEEYKVDGFYILDADSYGETYLNEIINELKLVNESIFVYTDSTTLGEYKTSDKLQNVLFGSLDNGLNQGIINGNFTKENFDNLVNLMFSGYYSDFSKNTEATKVINNIGSLSGIDIYSKLMLVHGIASKEEEILSKIKLGIYTIYSSVGIPRLVAGNEFLNTSTISNSEISSTPEDKMVCNDSKKLCYAKGDLKTIDWDYLVRNGSDVGKMISYRTKYVYQYPSYASMRANETISYNDELLQKGVLYLTINYKAQYKGDIEKSILIINYSNTNIEIDAISDRDYSKTTSLLGNLIGNEEVTKIYGYTFFTFTQTKQPKFGNWVYVLVVVGLMMFIFGMRYLLIWLLKTKKGIDYKEYNKEQRDQLKYNRKNKIKKQKEPGIFETYLEGESFTEKIADRIVNGKKKKAKKEVKNENDSNVTDNENKVENDADNNQPENKND